MKTLTAKGAKCGLGRLTDVVRAEPMAVAKHRRPAVVVMAVEEHERLTALDLINASAFADECKHW